MSDDEEAREPLVGNQEEGGGVGDTYESAGTTQEYGVDAAVEEGEYHEPPPEDLTTVCETFWNICNTIQGLPILAIPYTFKSGGWYSLITLLIVALASNYTSNILKKVYMRFEMA